MLGGTLRSVHGLPTISRNLLPARFLSQNGMEVVNKPAMRQQFHYAHGMGHSRPCWFGSFLCYIRSDLCYATVMKCLVESTLIETGWYHYDTMHFEYRPEIIAASK
jgi:hypothetical protein